MKSIFVLGDSISIQYGPYLETATQSFLKYSRKEGNEEALKNLDIPIGANGGNSKLVLDYLKHKVSSNDLSADYLLLNCGLHDIKIDNTTKDFQIPISEYERNLNEILVLLKPLPIKLIWIRTTPVVDGLHSTGSTGFNRTKKDCLAYNEKADAIMKDNEVPIIDLFTFTKNLGEDVYCDHVHFHEHVREEQGEYIANFLKDFIVNSK